jgi:glycosidase
MDRYSKYEGLGAFEKDEIQKNSPYYDWFIWREDAEKSDEKYEQWANPSLATLAEVDSYKNFAYRDDNSVTKYWLKMGIDGWRMDVAPWKSDTFWKEWRKEVKETNPEALTICESWFDSSKFFLGDQFDSTMNYVFRYSIYNYAKGGSAREFINILEMLRENYPPEAFYSLMNLLSTHDSSRALYEFGFKEEGESEDAVSLAKKRLLMCTFFQMIYPGAPTIYYGDEVGVTGGDDPRNRCTYPWEEDGGKADKSMLAEFKKLTALRNKNKILRRGSIEVVHVDDSVVVMLRKLGEEYAVAAVNNSLDAKSISVDLSKYEMPNKMTNPLDEEDTIRINSNKLQLTIEGVSGKLYLGKE